jgi:hypothetical protein
VSVATYLYCIVKAARKPSPARAPAGIPDASGLQILEVTPTLWLVTADVPLKTYGPGALDAALADLEWVGRIALAHESVVEHFATRRGVTVIPMKLFTMFSSPDRAIAEITSRKTAIGRVMRTIAGAEEWGVRIVRGEIPAAPVRRDKVPASGAAFLAARKRARDEVRSARLLAAEAAAGAFTRLARVAKQSVRREDPPPSGATPPLLDAAFLVPLRSRARFNSSAEREAAACARVGAQLTITGPWPPYNFVGLDGRV